MPIAVSIGVSVLYIALAAVYVIPCLHLIRYGIAIGRIRLSGGEAFEEALTRQKSFWRTLGIMVIAIMGLYFVGVVVAAVVAVVFGAAQTM